MAYWPGKHGTMTTIRGIILPTFHNDLQQGIELRKKKYLGESGNEEK